MNTKYRRRLRDEVKKKDRDRLTFRERLQEMRGKRTREEFAAMCGAAPTTAGEWLNAGVKGRARNVLPGAVYLIAMAEAFGVTTDWILGIKGAHKYPTQKATDRELADDVRDHVAREAVKKAAGSTIPVHELRENFEDFIPGGETLLQALVNLVAVDLRGMDEWFREKLGVRAEMARILAAMDPDEARTSMAAIEKILLRSVPHGKVILWEEVTYTNPDGSTESGHFVRFGRKRKGGKALIPSLRFGKKKGSKDV